MHGSAIEQMPHPFRAGRGWHLLVRVRQAHRWPPCWSRRRPCQTSIPGGVARVRPRSDPGFGPCRRRPNATFA